ncbi:unnamed protein product [Schistosoma turkestanicum]|nr:unnamed protein product [Schistosoma turkestanicum]
MEFTKKLDCLKCVYREYRMCIAVDVCETYEKILVNICVMLIFGSLLYMIFLLIPGNSIVLCQFLFNCFKYE